MSEGSYAQEPQPDDPPCNTESSTFLLLLQVMFECLTDDDFKRIMWKLDERLRRKRSKVR